MWKRRYGGDLYHLYPYIITAEEAFNKREPLMTQFYADAMEYAKLLKDHLTSIEILPETPKTNMFHVYLLNSYDDVIQAATTTMEKHKIRLFGGLTEVKLPLTGEDSVKSEISISEEYHKIPKETLI